MLDTSRLLAAAVFSLAYLGLCAAVFRRHRRRAVPVAAIPGSPAKPVLVAYASQSGYAEGLARQAAEALGAAGLPVTLAPLGQVDAAILAGCEQALFLVSTCGEGDAPDNGALFERRLMAAAPEAAPGLGHLHYGLLALGDREYAHFCAFGRRLSAWLEARGAQPLFSPVEADNGALAALESWQHQIAHIAGNAELPDWRSPVFTPWRLAERRHLNPGSSGAPVYHLALEPVAGDLPQWQAGDLVQIQPPGSLEQPAEHPRDYSIASLPESGRLHLLVRQQRHPDGRPGLTSGWLTAGAALGQSIALRLKPHANFRLGDNARRPLVLIGNGTGIAGLRALLQAREALGEKRNWLLFGERHAGPDHHYRADLERWQESGLLPRLDLAFSRDQEEKVYVQHKLEQAGAELRAWVDEGAALYVCGSAATMGAAVDAALARLLGREALDGLLAAGRYRRDVY
ncbi:MAG TPA: sulfite reductase subunit alpha [Azospira sp.]|nr:sulfite reductase subunit alpha [Azospira sp.]